MIKKFLVTVLLLSASVASAAPAEPQPGLWWNPSESGRGYAIDTQGSTMVVTVFAYDDNGRMQWYIASGPVNAGGYHWSGTLLKVDFGQPLNGFYVPPTQMGNDGVLTLDFTSRVTGFATLPNGRRIPIERQNFGVGNPPQALLGQWAYVYLIGSSPFVDIYKFTTIASATATGTGVVVDPARNTGFEYQSSGTFAGQVVGFHFSSTGTVLDQYLYQLQLEEGRGYWVAPTTYNQYGMNAYKMYTSDGISKTVATDDATPDLAAKGIASSPQGLSIDKLLAQDPARGELAGQIWQRLQEQRR